MCTQLYRNQVRIYRDTVLCAVCPARPWVSCTNPSESIFFSICVCACVHVVCWMYGVRCVVVWC